MRTISTLAVLMLVTSTSGQNLVPNGSFEEVSECPNSIGQLDRAIGWNCYAGSPELFHACSPGITEGEQLCDVPLNADGFQSPKSDDAYAGLFTHPGSGVPNYREYIGCELVQSLVEGQEYYFSMWVNCAGESGLIYPNLNASNNLGIFLCTNGDQYDYNQTETPLPIPGYSPLYNSEIVTDTVNWVFFTGSFIADSAYTHLAIGNFFDDEATETIDFNGDEIFEGIYYFIDDICLSVDNYCEVYPAIDEAQLNQWELVQVEDGAFAVRGVSQASVTLFDLGGTRVHSDPNYYQNKTINFRHYSSGMFFLQVQTKNRIQSFKIIKQ